MISHVQCCVAYRIRVRLNANVCIFERLETVGNGRKMRTMVDTVWRIPCNIYGRDAWRELDRGRWLRSQSTPF